MNNIDKLINIHDRLFLETIKKTLSNNSVLITDTKTLDIKVNSMTRKFLDKTFDSAIKANDEAVSLINERLKQLSDE